MIDRFKIDRIYIAPDSRLDDVTNRVLVAYPEVEVIDWPYEFDPLSPSTAEVVSKNSNNEIQRIDKGKRSLLLSRFHGAWLKPCPGTLGHVCCNLWVVNAYEGCPIDCTYCVLQDYLKRNPTLKIYTNTDDIISAIEDRIKREPNRLFRICTGELTDSLAWDDITGLSTKLIKFFAEQKNAVLELKTKTTRIENLLRLKNEHRGRTVVSWSVNALQVTAQDELFSATLNERMEAAQAVTSAGYRVGLHFDPIVNFPGWEEAYREAIKTIFHYIKPQNVAWISIATLRYRRDLQEIMIKRFPSSKLPFGEQFLAKDYKIRYIQPLRLKMLRFIWQELKSVWPTLPVYMCMESPAVWREITGGPPIAGDELVEIFSRRGNLMG